MAWVDDPLTTNTKIKPVHVMELREFIDDLNDVSCLADNITVYVGHYNSHENGHQINVHSSAETQNLFVAYINEENNFEVADKSNYNDANLKYDNDSVNLGNEVVLTTYECSNYFSSHESINRADNHRTNYANHNDHFRNTNRNVDYDVEDHYHKVNLYNNAQMTYQNIEKNSTYINVHENHG